MKHAPIPYKITLGVYQPVLSVESWFAAAAAGERGTGYVRTFDAHDWPRAAAYCMELRAGKLTGQH
jgi:hypothetical protein